jgi:hypothetical protein
MTELKDFPLKKLDQTKRTAGPVEAQYFEQRKNEGVNLRTRYQNNGPASQWGTGPDSTGKAHRKKGGPKSENHTVIRYTATGKRVKDTTRCMRPAT